MTVGSVSTKDLNSQTSVGIEPSSDDVWNSCCADVVIQNWSKDCNYVNCFKFEETSRVQRLRSRKKVQIVHELEDIPSEEAEPPSQSDASDFKCFADTQRPHCSNHRSDVFISDNIGGKQFLPLKNISSKEL